VLHSARAPTGGDDLRALEELVAPDVVRIFVGVDDAPRMAGHTLLNISIICRAWARSDCVSITTPQQVDEAGVGVTTRVSSRSGRKAVVADLFHFHGQIPDDVA